MKVLLTGSSGRIGRAIRAELVASGHRVIGLDRVPAAGTELVVDLGDAAALAAACAPVLDAHTAIVHCAALHAPHVGQWPDAEFQRINVDATRTLATLAMQHGVRHLVFTSTTALYGASTGHTVPGGVAAWIDESTLPQPATIYHRSKLAAEQCLKDASTSAGAGALGITVLRMSRCFPEPAPAMAVYRLQRGVDARDVARAHALALQRGPVAGEPPLIVSGHSPFLRSDAAALWRDAPAVLRERAPALVATFAQRGWPLPQRIDRVYCAERAQAALNWRPQFGPDEVLRQLDSGEPEVLPP